jgi:hypothetical protein
MGQLTNNAQTAEVEPKEPYVAFCSFGLIPRPDLPECPLGRFGPAAVQRVADAAKWIVTGPWRVSLE